MKLVGIGENTMIIHNYVKQPLKNKHYFMIYGTGQVITIQYIKGELKVRTLENKDTFFL